MFGQSLLAGRNHPLRQQPQGREFLGRRVMQLLANDVLRSRLATSSTSRSRALRTLRSRRTPEYTRWPRSVNSLTARSTGKMERDDSLARLGRDHRQHPRERLLPGLLAHRPDGLPTRPPITRRAMPSRRSSWASGSIASRSSDDPDISGRILLSERMAPAQPQV